MNTPNSLHYQVVRPVVNTGHETRLLVLIREDTWVIIHCGWEVWTCKSLGLICILSHSDYIAYRRVHRMSCKSQSANQPTPPLRGQPCSNPGMYAELCKLESAHT